MQDCRQAQQDMLDLLGGELPAHRRDPILTHIGVCADCRRDYAETGALLRTLRQAHTAALPDEAYWTRYEHALRQRLAADEVASRPRRRLSGWVWLSAAAAVLAAGIFVSGPSLMHRPRPYSVDAARAAHIERIDLLWRDLVNRRQPLQLREERGRARRILEHNSILRLEAEIHGDQAAANQLEQLEPLLLDIVHFPDQASEREWNTLRRRIRRLQWPLETYGDGRWR